MQRKIVEPHHHHHLGDLDAPFAQTREALRMIRTGNILRLLSTISPSHVNESDKVRKTLAGTNIPDSVLKRGGAPLPARLGLANFPRNFNR